MRAWTWTLVAALGPSAACGRVGFARAADATDDGSADMPAKCTPWSAPVLVPGLEGVIAGGPTLTANLKAMYFDDGMQMFLAARANVSDPFGPPIELVFQGGQNRGADPEVPADGSLLLFTFSEDLYVATPISRDTFQAPVRQSSLGSLANPQLSEGSAVLRFDTRPVSRTVWATRSATNMPWQVVSDLAELDPSGAVSLTADELTIVFERAVAPDDFRIFEATRANIADPFGPAFLTPGLADFPADEPWISPDGQALFMAVDVPAPRIWTATRSCP